MHSDKKDHFVFSEQEYGTAIEWYDKAIAINPFEAAYYGNRSFAFLRTECFGFALTDASKALKLDRKYIKVYSYGTLVVLETA